jgi:hypothetical protein
LLKAQLKETTAALNATHNEVRKKTMYASKIVKIDVPKEAWKGFGVNAKS